MPLKDCPKTDVSSKNKVKVSKKNIPFLLSIILCLLIIVFATSYGFFRYARSGREQNTIFTADLNILIDDNGDLGINQENSFPVYDSVGRQSDPYKFTLKNLGSVAANYVMRLVLDREAIEEDGCSDNLLSLESIKMQLIKDNVVVKETLLSGLVDYEIDSGFIGLVDGVNAYNYELRLWIDSNAGAEVMGRHYHGRIDVDIIDPSK